VRAPLDAVICLLPAKSTLSPGNDAAPPASLTTAAAPVSVPVPTRDSATDAPATPLPNASVSVSCTAGDIVAPATTFDGCVVNANVVAAAADTVNAVLVTGIKAPLDAVSCLLPARSTLSAENVARPLPSLATAEPRRAARMPTRPSATGTA